MLSVIKKSNQLIHNKVVIISLRGLAQRPCMEMFFKDKKFIVTGATDGIGKVVAQRLLDLEAYVFGVAKDKDTSCEINKKLTRMVVDVSDWNEAYCKLLEIGPVHGLVNIAGVAHIEPFLKMTQHGWDDTMNVNARGIIRASQAVVQNMLKEKIKGSIVNISSTISERVVLDHVSYCASKGAVNQITKAMALEFGPFGIRTNNVSPTVVLTKMGKKAWSDPEKAKPIMDRISLGRFLEPEEVADAVVFLLSDQSNMVNGISLYVDGGYMAT